MKSGGGKVKKIIRALLTTTFLIFSIVFLLNSQAYAGISQLTDNSYEDYNPRINDAGCVVWYGYDCTDAEIFLYTPDTKEDDGGCFISTVSGVRTAR